MPDRADVVVVGAGIAGVTTAFHLARMGVERVVLCDPRPPLTLTSDKSTECYRNWWPGPGDDMVRLMNRSIDLLESYAAETGNVFNLSRRGYLFATARPDRLDLLAESAAEISRLGAGPVRTHTVDADTYLPAPASGFGGGEDGADLFGDGATIRRHFPFLTPDVVGGLHARRAGWFSAQQLGAWMIDDARERGMAPLQKGVTGIDLDNGAVGSVTLDDGSVIRTPCVVNAAGPMLPKVAAMVDEELPVHSEVHLKIAFRDHLDTVPRDAPMIIWNDPQHIDWSADEREALLEADRADLLGEMPIFCHGRPEGGTDSPWVLGLWEYHRTVMEPVWPLPEDPVYGEVVLRGLATMVPTISTYRDRLPHIVVDGGYYTKTPENRPLGGPMRTPGMFVAGALSGFGVMAACAVGELAALHVTGSALPAHAPAFTLQRYEDAEYRARMATQTESGQL